MAADDDHHGHHDEHAPGRVERRPLAIALAITAVFLVVEVAGGLLTGSLALLADAGHMLTDVAALALALFATWLARRPATPARSFGYLRAEVLAALVNAAALIAVSLYIFWEAYRRVGDPPHVDSGPMLAVAVAGLLANAASAWVLSRGGGHRHSLNTRGAFLHVGGDLRGSAGAIIAALVMLATAGTWPTRCSRRGSGCWCSGAPGGCCASRWTCCWRRRRPGSTRPRFVPRSPASRRSRGCTTCTSGP